MEYESEEFKEVLNHAENIEKKLHESKLEKIAQKLLTLLEQKPLDFAKLLNNEHQGNWSEICENCNTNEPVLAKIQPEDFVEGIMKIKPYQRIDVLYSLSQRNKRYNQNPSIAPEIKWISSIKQLLLAKACNLGEKSIEAYQLKTVIEEYIPSQEDLSQPQNLNS